MLHRQDHKPQGNTWGMPAGKIDRGEEIKEAMIRELREETGFELPEDGLVHSKKLFVRYPEYDFIYHVFEAEVDRKEVSIREDEHRGFQWVLPKRALKMDLIGNLAQCIKLFYNVE